MFKLLEYRTFLSKKNGNVYFYVRLLYKNECVITIFLPHNEMLEEFLKNNLNEDITEYIYYLPAKESGLFRPYIKYK